MTKSLNSEVHMPTKLLVVLFLAAALALGQAVFGNIAGSITDQAGAAVPNAASDHPRSRSWRKL